MARIIRSFATLAALVVAYQLYLLLAVPFLEPQLQAREQQPSTPAQRTEGQQLVDKYQRLLAAYFPGQHWTQEEPPKVIESGPGMLVWDDDNQRIEYGVDGKSVIIELQRCALLYFPTPRQDGIEPPRDAVLVEAPQGASLEFDEDFNLAQGQLGKFKRGSFPGPITIRSDMREEGSHDDLLLETSDLRMISDLLFTKSKVRFRLGPNAGEGRHLEIRLAEEEPGSSQQGLNFSGVKSLEIHNDVKLELYLDAKSFLAPDESVSVEAKKPATRPRQQPVELTCAGSFQFDMQQYVASFDEDVLVWQFNPHGQSDQMSCQRLEIHFAEKDTAKTNSTAPSDEPREPGQDLGRLEPMELVATGFPVKMVSPSRAAEASGQRVRLLLRERRIALDGGLDTWLKYGSSLLRAPSISYTHPAEDVDTRVGSFRAQGAGTLDFAPNPDKPDELLSVEWQDSVALTRQDQQPLLKILGRPRLWMDGRGELIADTMLVYFQELARADPASQAFAFRTADGSVKQSTVVPDRLSARGNVVIDSPQLAGQTHELSAWFRYEPDSKKGNQEGGDSEPPSNRFAFAPSPGPVREAYAIQADVLRLEIALRGRRAVPTNLSCDGNVVFREMVTRNPADAPLVLHGQRLTVEEIDTGKTRIAVLGGEKNGPRPPSPAEMTARGVTLISSAVYLDEARNLAWIAGAGQAHVKLDRDLQGQMVGAPYPLEISWQDGLSFDGRRVELRGNVVGKGPNDQLRCQLLIGTLAEAVTIGQQAAPRTFELQEIDCQQGVVVDHVSRDVEGLTSHEEMELDRIVINQKTGEISGRGPGWVQSVHLSAEQNDLNALILPGTSQSPQSVATSNSAQRLQFLRVEFQKGLSGNLHRRELTFHERVRAVFGPIDAWQQRLDPNKPEGLPPSAISLRADELAVNEDPSLPRPQSPGTNGVGGFGAGLAAGGKIGPIEMVALGNVRLEGASSSNGEFVATAQRAAYSQLKTLFVLEGDGRTPATINYWLQRGSEPQKLAGRKITYNQTTGKINFEDFSADYTPAVGGPFGPRPAARPSAPLPR